VLRGPPEHVAGSVPWRVRPVKERPRWRVSVFVLAIAALLVIVIPLRLVAEPVPDRIDEYGRLLRYVIRARRLERQRPPRRRRRAPRTSTKGAGASSRVGSKRSPCALVPVISTSGVPARIPRTTPTLGLLPVAERGIGVNVKPARHSPVHERGSPRARTR
jgi:hypothetical protein